MKSHDKKRRGYPYWTLNGPLQCHGKNRATTRTKRPNRHRWRCFVSTLFNGAGSATLLRSGSTSTDSDTMGSPPATSSSLARVALYRYSSKIRAVCANKRTYESERGYQVTDIPTATKDSVQRLIRLWQNRRGCVSPIYRVADVRS